MHVIFIENYKKKAILSGVILAGWIVFFSIFGVLLNSNLLYNVTIDNFLKFSYPLGFDVDNIYINEQYSSNIIETSLLFNKPNMQKFSNFTSIEGKFSFEYPSIFSLNQQEFSGSEILYHIDFNSKQNSINGFVQVWNLPYSLEDFLTKSKSTSQLNFKYFNSNPVKVNGIEGFYWDYSFLSSSGNYFKGNEVFLQKDKRMYRISYFIPEELWTKEQEEIFKGIVYSFKVLNEMGNFNNTL